ncbi:hypothetical protein [Ferroplasma sp.]|uniref:hypothetical protein n=1 Tax=Ferroplasma sp. TaxID=2591003 RepID=UPI00307E39FF
MIKKILVIGIVMMIAGVAVTMGGVGYFESSFNSVASTHYIESKTTGLYVSNNITVKSGYIVMIDGATSTSGLVLHSKLSNVTNPSTLKANETKITSSDSGIELFLGLKSGPYNFVYFNGTSSPKYAALTGSQLDIMAAFVIAGVIIGFAGFIVMIYGAIKKGKPKNPYAADDPYNIDNIKI